MSRSLPSLTQKSKYDKNRNMKLRWAHWVQLGYDVSKLLVNPPEVSPSASVVGWAPERQGWMDAWFDYRGSAPDIPDIVDPVLSSSARSKCVRVASLDADTLDY